MAGSTIARARGFLPAVLLFVWLAALLSPPSSADIVGSDERVRVTPTTGFPNRAVVKLYLEHPAGNQSMCTGIMIGSFHVLTAGHCVYLHRDDDIPYDAWASQIEVIPGLDGTTRPYGEAFAVRLRVPNEYVANEDYRYDLGLLTLDRCLGDQTGGMARQGADRSSPVYIESVTTAGYPGDLGDGLYQYRTSADGDGADANVHWFLLDILGGQSGSPVWRQEGGEPVVVSVVTRGGEDSNLGTRLDDDRLQQLNAWMAADYAASPPCSHPDLVDAGPGSFGFSPPNVPLPNASLSVWTTVRNAGPVAASAFTVTFLLSPDEIITGADRTLAVIGAGPLAPSQSAVVAWNGTLPAGIMNGTYWVGWRIDSGNAVLEFDEGNNAGHVPSTFIVGPIPGAALNLTLYSAMVVGLIVAVLVFLVVLVAWMDRSRRRAVTGGALPPPYAVQGPVVGPNAVATGPLGAPGMRSCLGCGAPVHPMFRFCPYCGRPVA